MIEKKYDKTFFNLNLSNDFKNYLDLQASYISQTYIKWLQNIEIQTIPININNNISDILREIDRIDGILLTGGGNNMFDTKNDQKIPSEYLIKISHIYFHILKKNQRDEQFPIWATCLGFEAMSIAASRLTLKRSKVSHEAKDVQPIKIVDFNSRIAQFFTSDEIQAIQTKDLFYFNHKFGFLVEDFEENTNLKDFKVVAKIDFHDQNIVTLIEHEEYPFFGSQFHPEKVSKKDFISKGSRFYEYYINQKLALLFSKYLV